MNTLSKMMLSFCISILPLFCQAKDFFEIVKSIKPVFVQNLSLNTASGIIDNKDVLLITGATKVGVKTGLHSRVNLLNQKHFLDIGSEFQYQPQSFAYSDSMNNQIGKRNFQLLFVKIPIVYSYTLFKGNKGQQFLNLRFGNSFTFIPIKKIKDTDNPPNYTLKSFTREFIIGFSSSPFTNSRIGFQFDAYRSLSAVYKDPYHLDFKENGSGGISGFSLGILYQY